MYGVWIVWIYSFVFWLQMFYFRIIIFSMKIDGKTVTVDVLSMGFSDIKNRAICGSACNSLLPGKSAPIDSRICYGLLIS